MSREKTERLLFEATGLCEPFLRLLGARDIQSIDASPYEAATFIHNLNHPVSETLHCSFAAVIDSGTLEHVFNCPVAIANCMNMVEVGGDLISITPTNNLDGHGFYQLSAELFFRLFSEDNGYARPTVLIRENVSPFRWYQVADPNEVGSRGLLTNFRETYPLMLSRRTVTWVRSERPGVEGNSCSGLWFMLFAIGPRFFRREDSSGRIISASGIAKPRNGPNKTSRASLQDVLSIRRMSTASPRQVLTGICLH